MTSSGGGRYAKIHSRSKANIKSIQTQRVRVTRSATRRTGSHVHLTGDANIPSKHINSGFPGRTELSRTADAFTGAHFAYEPDDLRPYELGFITYQPYEIHDHNHQRHRLVSRVRNSVESKMDTDAHKQR